MSQRGFQYPFHAEAYVSGDASAGLPLTLYVNGIEYTLTATDGLAVTDFDIISENAANILLAANSDSAGERIGGGAVSANGGLVRGLQTPHYCATNKDLKVFGAATGKTRCIVHGFIYRRVLGA